MKFRKLFGVMAVAAFMISCFCLSPVLAENSNYNIRVMTQNMNPGADIAAVAFADDPIAAISDTITSIFESRIPDRAAIVAEEIAQNKPDLVALQEATRWMISTQSNGIMVLDQLEQLLLKLKAKGQHYKVVAAHELTSLDINPANFGIDPATIDLQEISYTDRDVVLVRSDLHPGQLKVLGSEIHEYDTIMEFPAFGTMIPVLRGWISVDMKANGSRFKFVTTHLESPVDDAYKPIQVAQADQLMAELNKSNFPVILAGDFNSDAEPTHYYDLDSTDSYNHIVMAGFSDAWDVLHPDPEDFGYTWPIAMDSINPETPIERIDLVFSNGPQPISIKMIGVNPVDDLFASDHAGIVAEFNLLGRHTCGIGRKPMNRAHRNPFQNLLHGYSHRLF
jgi:endonuclease/exonuclease/phosphatase family metal-dependent hydrolase